MRAHSGGTRFFEQHGRDPQHAQIFYAFLSVNLAEPERSCFIRYAERAILWSHFQKHKELPTCNFK